MKVCELIAYLKECDPELPVCIGFDPEDAVSGIVQMEDKVNGGKSYVSLTM